MWYPALLQQYLIKYLCSQSSVNSGKPLNCSEEMGHVMEISLKIYQSLGFKNSQLNISYFIGIPKIVWLQIVHNTVHKGLKERLVPVS